jgi:hypothetical protein
VLALHLPPLYSCPSSTHTRERERGRGRKERYLGERETYTHTDAPLKGSKPSAHPPYSHAHTHKITHGGLGGARAATRVLSLSQHTQDDGGTSPPHVHAAMLTHACLPCVIPPSPVFPAGSFFCSAISWTTCPRRSSGTLRVFGKEGGGEREGAGSDGGCRRWGCMYIHMHPAVLSHVLAFLPAPRSVSRSRTH